MNATAIPVETVQLCNIIDTDRIRHDLGDLDGLVASIREFGIIQPIVLQREPTQTLLVAGGRRLSALRRIGQADLLHGKDFIWRDEDISRPDYAMRLQALELEENLKRKELTWSEVVLGKQRLLEIEQSIHGESKAGTLREGESRGFGVRTLSSMLGESVASTSRDLDLAAYVKKFPMLAKLPTKQDALRKLGVAVTIAGMQASAKTNATQTSQDPTKAPTELPWRLYRGKFQDNIRQVSDSSVDLVATDLPYDIGVGGSTSAHAAGLNQFVDNHSPSNLMDMLSDVAIETYRILAPNRYAIFFFGFAYYRELYDSLTSAGFTIDDYPFIWIRNRTAPPSPARYAKTYDPALVCSKGDTTLLRPNLGNSMSVPSVSGVDRFHSAQKPVEIMERFILDMTSINSTVVDLMAGSGTTGVAALKNKRRTILFEMEEQNCILIESRLKAIK